MTFTPTAHLTWLIMLIKMKSPTGPVTPLQQTGCEYGEEVLQLPESFPEGPPVRASMAAGAAVAARARARVAMMVENCMLIEVKNVILKVLIRGDNGCCERRV